MSSPILVTPPNALYRVEIPSPALRFSMISPLIAAKPDEGNRFDVLGARVLYAATEPEGSYAETLASFRPKASLLAKMAAYAPTQASSGTVPAEWRRKRTITQLQPLGALPFLDIEATATHTHLTSAMADVLAAFNVNNLDVARVRGPNRLLTRALATWVYSQADEDGMPLYGGIRYVSKLGDYECWALFDNAPLAATTRSPISRNAKGLQEVADVLGLTIL